MPRTAAQRSFALLLTLRLERLSGFALCLPLRHIKTCRSSPCRLAVSYHLASIRSLAALLRVGCSPLLPDFSIIRTSCAVRAWTIAHSRSHSCVWTLYHLLRFSKACPRAGILLRRSAFFWHRAHALLALCSIFDPMLIWWLQARIVYLSTRSAPQSDRSPHEGASCTTFEPVRLLWNTRIQKLPVLVDSWHPSTI